MRAAIALLSLLVIALGACTKASDWPEPDWPLADVESLEVEDIVVGEGAEAVIGNTVRVLYTGYLTSGKSFDASTNPDRPFSFTLGAGRVIRGWEQGVAGMHVGGKRRLVIPPQLGYGKHGAGSAIPGGATLVFDIELLAVE